MLVCDYLLEFEGHTLPLSFPEPGTACEHHGGALSFGCPSVDLELAQQIAGHTVRVCTPEGTPIARMHVTHVDPELCLVSGDVLATPSIVESLRRRRP